MQGGFCGGDRGMFLLADILSIYHRLFNDHPVPIHFKQYQIGSFTGFD
jgi:hypothetical protein